MLPLLEMTGARELVEDAGFSPVRRVLVKWEDDFRERRDLGQSGLIVDRGRFDQILLERARTLGVQVLQPATIRTRTRDAVRMEAPCRNSVWQRGTSLYLARRRGRTLGAAPRAPEMDGLPDPCPACLLEWLHSSTRSAD